jgi:hypothetical protein
MNKKPVHSPNPGINRNNRISDDGLFRLEQQLKKGQRISHQVLQQWIKRYGDKAVRIIEKYQH